jgi:Type II secretion system (T2SS), protein M subtype b
VIEYMSPKQQRVVALGILGMAVTALWLGLFKPTIDVVKSRTFDRHAALRALGRDRTLVAQAPAIRTALASLEQSPRWGRFYESQKADKATLQMETELRALFKTPNTLTSMTAQPAVVQGPLTRIAVKVTLSMPIDQLAEALGQLQMNARLLQLESVTIQASDYQLPDTNPTLTILAEIAGFMQTLKATRT